MEGLISDDRPDDATREPPSEGDTITGEPSNPGAAITGERHDDINANGQAVQHVRGTIPMTWGVALDHAVADLRITKAKAIRESVGMFLRFHGHGEGIPQPLSPISGRR